MYFTTTTIITVGFGDISGVSEIEKFFCMGLMFLGGFMYSLTTGYLATIIQSEDAEKKILNHEISVLKKIKKKYNIDKEFYR